MKPLFAAAAVLLASVMPALADGKIYVQLPDLGSITGVEAERFLTEVVLANVISSNCADFAVSEEEWSLLTDSADILAHAQLRLNLDDYDSQYYGPAFDALDQADACAVHGPDVQPVLDRLVALGGSRQALPDQDKAYQAEQARQAEWDAMPPNPGKKTKSK